MFDPKKATDGAAQRLRILEALRRRPHTSYDLRQAGCYQCPTRVFELRRQGYEITTSRVTVTDSEGFRHLGIALYELVAEPAQGASV